MFRGALLGTIALLASSLLAANPSPKDEVLSAAKQLAEKDNYSWKTTAQSAGGGRFRSGPTEGKIAKDGLVYLAITRGENTIEAVLKGDKGAIKTGDQWISFAEATGGDGGQPGPARFLARMLQNLKPPAAEAQDLATNATELQKSDGVYAGDLTEEGVKQMLTFRRRSGDGPSVTNPKGTVKFWLKDGLLSKYEYNVQGTMNFNGNDITIDRTTTVEIKDIGSTSVDAPEEAIKKIS